MKYDDASWHYGGDFPVDQPAEHGGTHIALFLRWCLTKGWAGEWLQEESPDDITDVMNGTQSATAFLFAHDGKFVDDMLNDEGKAFANQYYGEDGLYLEDYSINFGHLMYVAPEDAHDFDQFSAMMEQRLKSGILTKAQFKATKKWWKFW
ncbi:DUF7832 domain-containing protein [Oxalicibacterium faecigallinarum]|uniref:DUF7832 domain-containing protein n=1 Tax=Oxalicibacterium faecigallinarum TaxID=573741 RepID=A0A8J3ASU7_9BURK|nr:hypothetical protein [Oxalicibacterium faecigallinarum]GGI21471.1 hypothetical protein GCM10008066_29230 [Oxalicibacterium faecigallinarum]